MNIAPLAIIASSILAVASPPRDEQGDEHSADFRTAKLRTAIRVGVADWLDSTRAAEVYRRAPRVPRRSDTRMHLVGVVGGVCVVGSLASGGPLGWLALAALVAFGAWGLMRRPGATDDSRDETA